MRHFLLRTILLFVALAAVAVLHAANVQAGEFDGSACDDAGIDRPLRRICHAYCDARACASETSGSLAPVCRRLLNRYLRRSGGETPPCEVLPKECREACRPAAWRSARRCRADAAADLDRCDSERLEPRCPAKVAATLDECLESVRRRYRACIDDCTGEDACLLPKDSGPCKAVIPRWYFDGDAGSCDRFVWGGCGGNANNFETRIACRAACGADDLCELPADVGPCDAVIPRWYYDSDTGACKQFNYGGCAGNDNNFATLEACMAECGESDPCKLPADPGPCTAAIERWSYDADRGRCVRFPYGGCAGNENNYQTFAECAQACGAEDPCASIRCRDDQECRLDEASGEGYCADTCALHECPDGQVCRLQEVQCIRSPCPPIAACVPDGSCGLPKDQGDCLAVLPRWWHNPATGRCEEFVYGGCGGNDNNFETLADCQLACMDCEPGDGADVCEPDRCDPTSYYCETFVGGVAGSPVVYQCLPLPEACLPAADSDCSCFELSSRGCSCQQDASGGFVVDCAAP